MDASRTPLASSRYRRYRLTIFALLPAIATVIGIVVLTQIFGLPLEAATGIALLIWILTFVAVVPFGLLLAFHEGLNFRKLKHLREEAAT